MRTIPIRFLRELAIQIVIAVGGAGLFTVLALLIGSTGAAFAFPWILIAALVGFVWVRARTDPRRDAIEIVLLGTISACMFTGSGSLALSLLRGVVP